MSDPVALVDVAAIRDEEGFRNRGAEVTRLEAFLDAAFAFAVTLMVISLDEIPKNATELIAALKSVPAFGGSFLVIALFWRGHADWSRHYGLNDRYSQRLSLLLVFLVLIFVYPLRMVFSVFFAWITNGTLPANLSFETIDDIRLVFIVFALAFGSMGTAMFGLYRHAWSQRARIGLDAIESLMTRHAVMRWGLLPLFSLLSLALAAWRPMIDGWDWMLGLPGFVFFGLFFVQRIMRVRMRRRILRMGGH